MKWFVLLIALLIAVVSKAQTQNTWTKKTSFEGNKRSRAVAFSIDNYGYVGTGEDTADMTHNDLWRYDPLLDSWTQMSSLPGSTRRNAIGTTLNGKGYLGLGADSSVSGSGIILDDWWEYDPLINQWSQKTSYPGGYNIYNQTGTAGVYFSTAFAIDSVVYVCGGKMGPNFYGTDLWKYNPTTDIWTRLADFPGGDRHQLSSFAIEGNGFVGMGIDHDLYRKDWWKYDPITDSWTEVAELPGVERGAASTFVLGQHGFVVFGSDGGYKDELWEYDPFANSWQIRSNFPADGRKNAIAFAIADTGYAGLGTSSSGKRKSFYAYTPFWQLGIYNEEISINTFPNPASNFINITVPNSLIGQSLQIFSLDGKKAYSELITSTSRTVNLVEFARGTYILIIVDQSGTLISEKINVL